MGFQGSLHDFVAQIPDDSGAALQGLDLAESEINAVITVIENERAKLDPSHFKDRGHISDRSFGGGDRAPALALHHHRAHGVTADTLDGVLADLLTFQQACRDAKNAIVEADETAAADLRAKGTAATSLTVGSMTNQGQSANTQAQYDHQDDTTSDQPPTDESSPTRDDGAEGS